MKRHKGWKKWDELQKLLRPIEERYARAGLKAAQKVFGKKCFAPPIRLGVLVYLDPKLSVALEMARQEPRVRAPRRAR